MVVFLPVSFFLLISSYFVNACIYCVENDAGFLDDLTSFTKTKGEYFSGFNEQSPRTKSRNEKGNSNKNNKKKAAANEANTLRRILNGRLVITSAIQLLLEIKMNITFIAFYTIHTF